MPQLSGLATSRAPSSTAGPATLGTGNQPGFANAALHDWLPGAGSPLVNAGNNLGDLPAWALPVAQPGAVRLRKQDGGWTSGRLSAEAQRGRSHVADIDRPQAPPHSAAAPGPPPQPADPSAAAFWAQPASRLRRSVSGQCQAQVAAEVTRSIGLIARSHWCRCKCTTRHELPMDLGCDS